ncbi:hypothetical protein H9L39_17933 [Fusarium oxysporum f. sp. albedinis]|nr:hypothetical protein H9L39_17933 [Fusarium oxysporum f. sp. albedinis]
MHARRNDVRGVFYPIAHGHDVGGNEDDSLDELELRNALQGPSAWANPFLQKLVLGDVPGYEIGRHLPAILVSLLATPGVRSRISMVMRYRKCISSDKQTAPAGHESTKNVSVKKTREL